MENGRSTSESHFIGDITTSILSSSIADGKQTGALMRVCVRSKAEKGKLVLLLLFQRFPPLIKPKGLMGSERRRFQRTKHNHKRKC